MAAAASRCFVIELVGIEGYGWNFAHTSNYVKYWNVRTTLSELGEIITWNNSPLNKVSRIIETKL